MTLRVEEYYISPLAGGNLGFSAADQLAKWKNLGKKAVAKVQTARAATATKQAQSGTISKKAAEKTIQRALKARAEEKASRVAAAAARYKEALTSRIKTAHSSSILKRRKEELVKAVADAAALTSGEAEVPVPKLTSSQASTVVKVLQEEGIIAAPQPAAAPVPTPAPVPAPAPLPYTPPEATPSKAEGSIWQDLQQQKQEAMARGAEVAAEAVGPAEETGPVKASTFGGTAAKVAMGAIAVGFVAWALFGGRKSSRRK